VESRSHNINTKENEMKKMTNEDLVKRIEQIQQEDPKQFKGLVQAVGTSIVMHQALLDGSVDCAISGTQIPYEGGVAILQVYERVSEGDKKIEAQQFQQYWTANYEGKSGIDKLVYKN